MYCQICGAADGNCSCFDDRHHHSHHDNLHGKIAHLERIIARIQNAKKPKPDCDKIKITQGFTRNGHLYKLVEIPKIHAGRDFCEPCDDFHARMVSTNNMFGALAFDNPSNSGIKQNIAYANRDARAKIIFSASSSGDTVFRGPVVHHGYLVKDTQNSEYCVCTTKGGRILIVGSSQVTEEYVKLNNVISAYGAQALIISDGEPTDSLTWGDGSATEYSRIAFGINRETGAGYIVCGGSFDHVNSVSGGTELGITTQDCVDVLKGRCTIAVLIASGFGNNEAIVLSDSYPLYKPSNAQMPENLAFWCINDNQNWCGGVDLDDLLRRLNELKYLAENKADIDAVTIDRVDAMTQKLVQQDEYNEQSREIAQAAVDEATNAVAIANEAKQIATTADSNSNTALNIANSAATTANNAETMADGAISTANAAVNIANDAKTQSTNASSSAAASAITASQAKTAAENAQSAAEAASQEASEAASAAQDAVETANEASAAALAVADTANTALSNSENAINTAQSAISGLSNKLDKGSFTGTAETLAVRITNNSNALMTKLDEGSYKGTADDIINLIGTKADTAALNTALAQKADTSYVDAEISEVNNTLSGKTDKGGYDGSGADLDVRITALENKKQMWVLMPAPPATDNTIYWDKGQLAFVIYQSGSQVGLKGIYRPNPSTDASRYAAKMILSASGIISTSYSIDFDATVAGGSEITTDDCNCSFAFYQGSDTYPAIVGRIVAISAGQKTSYQVFAEEVNYNTVS